MPAIDTNDLMGDARCVDSCIPPGAQLPVLISIFAQIANMSLDPATLMAGARCVDNCVPVGMRMSVLISLAQQILDNGGGGGGGSGGNANLIPDGTDPNGTETATQGLRYDSLGNVWLKTNGVNNATGWEKITQAPGAIMEEEAQPNAQWPTRTSAKAPLFVSGATLPASPQFVAVKLSEPRSSRMRRFLDALKTFVMNFFSFLPLILFLIIFSPSQSKAIPPPLLFNFCTTNTPTVLSNIFKSFVTNTGNANFVKKTGDTMSGALTINAQLTADAGTFPLGTLVGDQSLYPFGQNQFGDLTAEEVIALNYISVGGVLDGYINVSDASGSQLFYASTSNTIIGAESGPTPIILNVDGTSLFSGNITNAALTANRAVVSDANKALASSSTTDTELGYVHSVTGPIQAQLDGKQAGPLTGDVTSSGAATTLKNTGTAGTYTKTTFDAQGRETSGTSATLASSDYANQGTTTTLLHGNAAGNPSWAKVDLANDVSGTLSSSSVSGIPTTNNLVATNDSRTLVFSGNLESTNTTTANRVIVTNGNVSVIISNAPAVGQYGLDLSNRIAAASGSQQYSPFLHLAGNGWKTTATAASQPVEFALGVAPVQGTANPTAILVLSNSINGAAYGEIVRISSAGVIIAQVGVTGNGSFYLGGDGTSAAAALFLATSQLRAQSGTQIGWNSQANQSAGGIDTALGRNVAGIVEANNGTAGNYRDLLARNVIATNTITATNGFVWAATIVAPVTLSNIVVTNITLDFPSTAAGATSDLLVNIANVKAGDFAFASAPAASSQANSFYSAWVSNTFVYVQFHNEQLVSAIDPASGTFAVRVDQFK